MPSTFPPPFVSEWAHDETREVDQVMGAFFFVRRSVFEALGGFDERFFVYFEDMDFAVRARERGWRSVYLATAQAFHRGQGTTERAVPRRMFYFARSRILYARKHFGTLGATSVIARDTCCWSPCTGASRHAPQPAPTRCAPSRCSGGICRTCCGHARAQSSSNLSS